MNVYLNVSVYISESNGVPLHTAKANGRSSDCCGSKK